MALSGSWCCTRCWNGGLRPRASGGLLRHSGNPPQTTLVACRHRNPRPWYVGFTVSTTMVAPPHPSPRPHPTPHSSLLPASLPLCTQATHSMILQLRVRGRCCPGCLPCPRMHAPMGMWDVLLCVQYGGRSTHRLPADPLLCPLCRHPRQNPAASSSGILFCHRCV
jgi:hypothetical protein